MKPSEWLAVNKPYIYNLIDYRFMQVEAPPEETKIHEFDELNWPRCREQIALAFLEEFFADKNRYPNIKDDIKFRAYEPFAPRPEKEDIPGRFHCIIWWSYA